MRDRSLITSEITQYVYSFSKIIFCAQNRQSRTFPLTPPLRKSKAVPENAAQETYYITLLNWCQKSFWTTLTQEYSVNWKHYARFKHEDNTKLSWIQWKAKWKMYQIQGQILIWSFDFWWIPINDELSNLSSEEQAKPWPWQWPHKGGKTWIQSHATKPLERPCHTKPGCKIKDSLRPQLFLTWIFLLTKWPYILHHNKSAHRPKINISTGWKALFLSTIQHSGARSSLITHLSSPISGEGGENPRIWIFCSSW